ncbi:MAG: rhomboid family intramembrane serine protease [Thermodesulfobacteriota bacterium]
MIPLRDTTRSSSFPVVNTILIISNVIVFLYEISLGQGSNRFIIQHGLIPGLLFSSTDMGIVERFSPFLTSLFIHGGFLHLVGNMLFLYIFGDNVEDKMGHFKYLIFYISCGFFAALFQMLTNIHSTIPMIGASGAISGVLGAYLIFFPKSRILTLLPIFFFIQLIHIPAAVFIIVWFIFQFLSGVATLPAKPGVGGVAFWAHIGGFVSGLILARFFHKKGSLSTSRFSKYYN